MKNGILFGIGLFVIIMVLTLAARADEPEKPKQGPVVVITHDGEEKTLYCIVISPTVTVCE
jgi:hypothetical protein